MIEKGEIGPLLSRQPVALWTGVCWSETVHVVQYRCFLLALVESVKGIWVVELQWNYCRHGRIHLGDHWIELSNCRIERL